MADELGIHLTAGLTLQALIWGQERSKRWDGEELTDPELIANADWATGMVAMFEEYTASSTNLGRYTGNFPTKLKTAGEYEIEYYTGASPPPSQRRVGHQIILWDGSKISTTATLSAQIIQLIENMELVVDTGALREALAAITIPNKQVVLGPAAERQDCNRVVMGAAEGQDCERVVMGPAEEKESCNRVVVGPCRSTPVVGVVRNSDGTIRITRR